MYSPYKRLYINIADYDREGGMIFFELVYRLRLEHLIYYRLWFVLDLLDTIQYLFDAAN